jgi:hypothetical protein
LSRDCNWIATIRALSSAVGVRRGTGGGTGPRARCSPYLYAVQCAFQLMWMRSASRRLHTPSSTWIATCRASEPGGALCRPHKFAAGASRSSEYRGVSGHKIWPHWGSPHAHGNGRSRHAVSVLIRTRRFAVRHLHRAQTCGGSVSCSNGPWNGASSNGCRARSSYCPIPRRPWGFTTSISTSGC